MARKPRFNIVGIPQHVVQRGNNRTPCFFCVSDWRRYLRDLRQAAEENHADVHAYVLMTNHVHLLVTPRAPYSITHMMQDLGRKYVRYVNRTHQRTGALWEGRFKASLVDSEGYLLTCMRYIELNPVRAGMVMHPGEYGWSSYAHNGMGKEDLLITPHPLYAALGEDTSQITRAYRELFRSPLASEALHAVREALHQELVLGREGFKDQIEMMTKRQARPGQVGRPRVEEATSADYYRHGRILANSVL
ncbi:MAG: transposase [Gammaproteobacteria bacterium]|nr:transposase [Gammaproteobacteria bacterium]NIR28449.1 transposase [Gammaproteobacteria bacterium]NIR96895.1 transposase [Gammaproteobacteria bacterium]NIT62596.1 transposase [Gammaproteobacteria bacterium]NIV19553.1 transposase [Gammaproteobacteria bacterium]